MKVYVSGEEIEIVILRKRIKNIYLRVKSDLKIYASCNSFVREKDILNLISDNEGQIKKMIDRERKKREKASRFFYLGKEYKAVIYDKIKKPTIDGDYIYVKNDKEFDKFLVSEAKRLFPVRLKMCYEKMGKCVPFPKLVIRKMVRKWGHCNKRDEIVTLNTELIKYGVDEIDYVIVHELCHFLHFDHSKEFWECVKYFKPNYKDNKKVLREE